MANIVNFDYENEIINLINKNKALYLEQIVKIISLKIIKDSVGSVDTFKIEKFAENAIYSLKRQKKLYIDKVQNIVCKTKSISEQLTKEDIDACDAFWVVLNFAPESLQHYLKVGDSIKYSFINKNKFIDVVFIASEAECFTVFNAIANKDSLFSGEMLKDFKKTHYRICVYKDKSCLPSSLDYAKNLNIYIHAVLTPEKKLKLVAIDKSLENPDKN